MMPAATKPAEPSTVFSPTLSELLAVVGYLAAFVIVATLVSSHGRPHADAVMVADPAINYVTGKGDVSFIHSQIVPGSSLGDSTPVYGRALIAWLKAFGVSGESVMSMNAVVIAATTFLMWLFLSRSSLLCHMATRLAYVAALPMITPVWLIYRINRYDSFGMLGLAAGCAAITVRERMPRFLLLATAGFLVGTAGFHVIIGVGLLTLLALAVLGRRFIGDFLAMNAGIAFGLGVVVRNLIVSGSLESTRRVLEQNGVGDVRPLSWHLLAPIRGGLHSSIFDADLLLLGALGCVAIGAIRRYQIPSYTKAALFGIMSAVLIPVTLSGFGRYSATYAWLAGIPVFTCCMIALDRDIRSGIWSACVAVLLGASAFTGFPAHALMLALEWGPQDRHVTDAWVESHLRSDDVVYACTSNYYPAKRTPRTAYIGSAFHSMTEEQRASVTVLVMDGHENGTAMFEPNVEVALASFGGDWDLVAELKTPRGELRSKIPPKPKSDCTYHVMIYHKRAVE